MNKSAIVLDWDFYHGKLIALPFAVRSTLGGTVFLAFEVLLSSITLNYRTIIPRDIFMFLGYSYV